MISGLWGHSGRTPHFNLIAVLVPVPMTNNPARIRDETVVTRSDAPLSTTIEDETVLLNPDSGTYHGLNEVGTRVWTRLESPVSVGELETDIADEHGIAESEVGPDIRVFLADLLEADLIEVRSATDGP